MRLCISFSFASVIFTTKDNTFEVANGTRVELPCGSIHTELDQVIWLNDTDIDRSLVVRRDKGECGKITTGSGWQGRVNMTCLPEGNLVFHSVALNDAGTYQCVLRSNLRYFRSYIQLTIGK